MLANFGMKYLLNNVKRVNEKSLSCIAGFISTQTDLYILLSVIKIIVITDFFLGEEIYIINIYLKCL